MASLLLKDVPRDLHERLKARARAHNRSLRGEILVLLREALDDRAGPPTLEEIDRLRVRGRAPLTDDLLERARSEGRP